MKCPFPLLILSVKIHLLQTKQQFCNLLKTSLTCVFTEESFCNLSFCWQAVFMTGDIKQLLQSFTSRCGWCIYFNCLKILSCYILNKISTFVMLPMKNFGIADWSNLFLSRGWKFCPFLTPFTISGSSRCSRTFSLFLSVQVWSISTEKHFLWYLKTKFFLFSSS